ncbi:MAG: glycosyltransferase family A protein [Pseudomonadota bacterium]
MIEFSVVIPVYNKEPHVARAIASVLNQSCPPREILVIDDASTDRSIEIIAEMAGDKVRMLERDTPGPGGYAARNLGIKEATSAWIAFLDADDAWKPDHLATLDATLETAPDTVGCAFVGNLVRSSSDDDAMADTVTRMPVCETTHLDFDDFLRLWLAFEDSPVHTSGTAIKRSVLLDVGGFPEGRCERGGDKDLWLRTCAATEALAIAKVTSIYYRDAINMVTRQASQNRAHCMCYSLDKLQASSSGERRKLLQKLHNFEVFRYAVLSWRKGDFDRSQFRQYYTLRDPIGFLMLQGMKVVPERRVRMFRPLLRKLRGVASGNRQEVASEQRDAGPERKTT